MVLLFMLLVLIWLVLFVCIVVYLSIWLFCTFYWFDFVRWAFRSTEECLFDRLELVFWFRIVEGYFDLFWCLAGCICVLMFICFWIGDFGFGLYGYGWYFCVVKMCVVCLLSFSLGNYIWCYSLLLIFIFRMLFRCLLVWLRD